MNNNIHGIKYGSGVKKEAKAGAGSGRREEGTSGRRDPRPFKPTIHFVFTGRKE